MSRVSERRETRENVDSLEGQAQPKSPSKEKVKRKGRRKRRNQDEIEHSRKPPPKKTYTVLDPATEAASWGVLYYIPVEILCEIFSWLRPVDMLNMARTSKHIRAFLMNRSCLEFSWKAARSNIHGLPECPEDLSEPQYADLCFMDGCHACEADPSKIGIHIHWEFRVRLCETCFEKRFADASPWNDFGIGKRLKNFGYPSLCPKLRHLREKYYCKETARLWKVDFNRAKDKGAWAENKKLEIDSRKKHGAACSDWKKCFDALIEGQKQEVVEARFDLVLNRLKNGRWAQEFHLLNDEERDLEQSATISGFCENFTTITERTWLGLEPIFDEGTIGGLDNLLDSWMEKRKTKRIQREWGERHRSRIEAVNKALKAYTLTLPINSVVPSIGDVVFHPHIKSLILDRPDSAFKKSNPLPGLDKLLPDILQEVQSEIEDKLIDLVASSCDEDFVFDRKTVLNLATTAFTCISCSEGLYSNVDCRMHYLRAIIHSCATNLKRIPRDQDPDDGIDLHILYKATGKGRWNSRGMIIFKEDCVPHLSDIVRTCGFDPLTATVTELDAADPILECLSCNDLDLGRATMRWSTALLHKEKAHYHESLDLEVLSSNAVAQYARLRMDEEVQRLQAHNVPLTMACARCRKEPKYFVELLEHLEYKHRVTTPHRSDFVVKLDSDYIEDVFYLWPPRA